jgi:hypothetical protein
MPNADGASSESERLVDAVPPSARILSMRPGPDGAWEIGGHRGGREILPF